MNALMESRGINYDSDGDGRIQKPFAIGAYVGPGSTYDGYHPTVAGGVEADADVYGRSSYRLGFRFTLKGYKNEAWGDNSVAAHTPLALKEYTPGIGEGLRYENAVEGLRTGIGPLLSFRLIDSRPVGLSILQSIGFMLDYRQITYPTHKVQYAAGNQLDFPGGSNGTKLIPEGYSTTQLAMTTKLGLDLFGGFSVKTNRDYSFPIGLRYRF
ncbi:MAG: hypothetical protein ABIG42_05145 [bacterium]